MTMTLSFRIIHLIFTISYLCSLTNLFGQEGVSIGITTPDESSILHIQGDGDPKGLLIPRYNTSDRDNIEPKPNAPGLIIYNTDLAAFEYFDGSAWVQLIPTPAKFDVNMGGNKLTNLANGTVNLDAVNKGQLDTSIGNVDASNLNRSGNEAMTGNLNVGNNRIINLSDGTNASDAVTKDQLDNLDIPELWSTTGGGASWLGGVRWTIIDTGSTERKNVDLTAWSDILGGSLTIQIRGGATRPGNPTANDLIVQRNFNPSISTATQATVNFSLFNTSYRYFHIRTDPNGGDIAYYGLKVRITD